MVTCTSIQISPVCCLRAFNIRLNQYNGSRHSWTPKTLQRSLPKLKRSRQQPGANFENQHFKNKFGEQLRSHKSLPEAELRSTTKNDDGQRRGEIDDRGNSTGFWMRMASVASDSWSYWQAVGPRSEYEDKNQRPSIHTTSCMIEKSKYDCQLVLYLIEGANKLERSFDLLILGAVIVRKRES